MDDTEGWRCVVNALGFDIGGTFTDMAMLDPEGQRLRIHKVLTTPGDPAQGALSGIGEFVSRHDVGYSDLSRVVHASTLVTNALIQGTGASVGLITTQGFRDVLEMGTEQRFDIYDLFLRFPPPLSPRHLRHGIAERIDRDGRVLQPVDPDEVEAVVAHLRRMGVHAIAVSLLHSYRNPVHEQEVARVIAKVWPEVSVSLSSEVAPEIREYERTSTTVANAYVQPIVARYLVRLQAALTEAGMQGGFYPVVSTGSAVPLKEGIEQSIRLLESGPAAGAILAGQLGQSVGKPDVLSFDMGGTTAKLCLVENGRPSIAATMEAARTHRFKRGSGYPIRIPTVDMLEVGAGGGSVAWVDALGLLKVGPRSAGADPGPAAYGAGGNEPTVTDADLLLGYLNPTYFLGGEMELDPGAAAHVLEQFGRQLGLGVTETAAGIHRLVNDNMAAAARLHVIEKGRDPRRYALVCFGGAGPVHAAGVARTIGAEEIIVPDHAGVASAVGLLLSPLAFEFVRSYPVTLSRADWKVIGTLLTDMESDGKASLREAGIDDTRVTVEHSVEGRFQGQLHEIRIGLPADVDTVTREALVRDFHDTYRRLYGHLPGDLEIELLTWRTRVAAPATEPPSPESAAVDTDPEVARKDTRSAFFAGTGGFVHTAVYERAGLTAGMRIDGPALVEERESTTVVPPGMHCAVDEHMNLRLRVRKEG